MNRADTFIRRVVSSTIYHPDGTVETTKAPAVWTLAHRGYSGCGRLDIWVYPTRADALREGARLAMACGLDEDGHAVALFRAGKYAQLLEYYEQTHPETHLLRVSRPSCTTKPDRSASAKASGDVRDADPRTG